MCLALAASAQSDIRYYFDPGQVPEEIQNLLLSGQAVDIEERVRESGLAIIEYSPTQFVVAPYDMVNTSLAVWQKREELLARQRGAGEVARIIVVGDPDQMASESAIVSGTIVSEESGEPIVGATIMHPESGEGAATDFEGAFELEVPTGEIQLEMRSIGFATQDLDIIVYGDGELQLIMSEGAVRLDEIIISEEAPDENVRSSISGIERLQMREIKKLPSLMGQADVLKSLLTLPGVSTAGDGVAGINVRGGNVDHNLIIQDDIIYFNPTHALGFFSLFHPDMVDEAELYKGHMPARYGGRLSSVLSVSTRSGNPDEWKFKGGVGTVTSTLAVEGPLGGENTTLIAGGRFAYPDWILQSVKVPEVKNSSASFYDFQGKLEHRITRKAIIGVQGYYGYDRFKFDDQAEFQYASTAGSIYYRQLLGDRTNLNVRATYGNYDSDLNDLKVTDPSTFTTGIRYFKGNINMVTQLAADHRLTYGVEAVNYNINPGEINPSDENSDVKPEKANGDKGLEMGAFVEYQVNPIDRIEIIAGLRFSGLMTFGPKTVNLYSGDEYLPENVIGQETYAAGEVVNSYFGFEPRIGAKFSLNSASSIKLSYNRTFQYLSLISNSVAATPVDFWKLSDTYIPAQSSHNFSLGYYRNFKNNMWATYIEGYYRTIEDIPEYRDFPDLIVNDHLETELLFAEGSNYGIEASVKKNIGRVTGRVSLTWSRALRRVKSQNPEFELNNGSWYPSNFDKPITANFLFNYNFSQRISLNVFFTYSTGRPATIPESKYSDWNVLNVPAYSGRNQYRIPDYHRMDISLTIFPGYRSDKKLKGSWTFALFNVYGRKNAYSVYFQQEPFQAPAAYRLAVLGSVFPSISYNFEF